MSYLIGMIIGIVLLVTIIFSITYYFIIFRSDEIKKLWQGIMSLLNQRVLLLRNMMDRSADLLEVNCDLSTHIQEFIILNNSTESIQEIVDSSLQLSNAVEGLCHIISLHNDEDLRILANQLNEIESHLRELWNQYNYKVSVFNEWVSKFPMKRIAIMFGVRPYDYILLDDE